MNQGNYQEIDEEQEISELRLEKENEFGSYNGSEQNYDDRIKSNKSFWIPLAVLVIAIWIFIEVSDPENEWISYDIDIREWVQKGQYIDKENEIKPILSNQAKTIFEGLEQKPNPSSYEGISKIKYFQELPFCLVVDTEAGYKDIESLVEKSSYKNAIVVKVKNPSAGYDLYKRAIAECEKNALIIFAHNPLNFNLEQLNEIHQREKVWLTFSQNRTHFQIVSFYSRIWELLQSNAFTSENQRLLGETNKSINIQHFTLSLLEMCFSHSKSLNNDFPEISRLLISKQESAVERDPYQMLIKMSQDYFFEEITYELAFHNLKHLNDYATKTISPFKMIRAIEFEEIAYLPSSHSLLQLEYIYFNSIYNLENVKQEANFCITILNHDNIENNRYERALKSLFEQNYTNFHTVFIDDFSNSDNTEKVIEYLKKLNVSTDKIELVKNLKRKSSTYNIINAAFNFCDANSIQLVFDLNGQFIGRYALQVINSQYQQNENAWIVYSNFKSNVNGYGASQSFEKMNQVLIENKRKANHILDHIKTWKVKLVKKIPLEHHLSLDGNEQSTLNDDAIQYPLFELCGSSKRIIYLPEVLYEKNESYNEDSILSIEEEEKKKESYRHIISLIPLKAVEDLDSGMVDMRVVEILKRDDGVEYKMLERV